MRSDRAHPDAINFGLQSKDMGKAGLNALKEDSKSFSTIATVSARFNQFADYMRQVHSIRDLRRVELNHVRQYAELLKEKTGAGSLKPATAQNYLSAVNRVLEIARGDNQRRIEGVKEAGLSKRSHIATVNKALANPPYQISQLTGRLRSQFELGRAFGLRFKEAALLDCRAALMEAHRLNQITISRGVKGGNHDRIIHGINSNQLSALNRALDYQGSRKNLIPDNLNYKQYYDYAHNAGVRFHAGRHEYAQNRYKALTGVSCPVVLGFWQPVEWPELSLKTRFIFNAFQTQLSRKRHQSLFIGSVQLILFPTQWLGNPL